MVLARVLARWLRVLTSYAGQPKLTMITFETVLKQLRTWRGCLKSQIDDWQIALIYKKYRHKKMTKNKEDDDVWSLEDDEYSLEFTLIGVLGWKDSYSTLIEISLPIILYLFYTWSAILHSPRKVVCTLFQNLHFYSRDLQAEFYPFTLSILRVAYDQVWYKRSLLYNSNFFKSNGSASLFGEAQLDNTKLRSFYQIYQRRFLDNDKFCIN